MKLKKNLQGHVTVTRTTSHDGRPTSLETLA